MKRFNRDKVINRFKQHRGRGYDDGVEALGFGSERVIGMRTVSVMCGVEARL